MDAFDPANLPPNPTVFKTTALWDTGATKSAISALVAKKLGLTSTGTTEVTHAVGKSKRSTYVVNFLLPNQVGMSGLHVTEVTPGAGVGWEVIVGMDVLSLTDFALTNVGGNTVVSLRTPSIKTIDYVQVANEFKYRNVGRNDDCPCRSGKKFKKCHGKKK